MNSPARSASPEHAHKLQILCAPEGDAYRVYVWPNHLRRDLAACLDSHGELYPTYLDIEELDRKMQAAGVTYERRDSIDGSFEIDVEGQAAVVLTQWLVSSFKSGVQAVV